MKVLRFEVLIEKVIAKEETAAERYTLLNAQRQLCVVAVPLKRSNYYTLIFLKKKERKKRKQIT